MKVSKASIILSWLATICFFIAYFVHKDTMTFVLGCTWFCISIEEGLRIKNKNDKENKK